MQTKASENISKKDKSPLVWGLVFGILFGFLLQKGGATKYDIIIGQLLLSDFTVLKIMLSAVLTGMIGIYLMKALGWVELNPKSGSMGSNIIGGLIFGVGFAVLGYCPGTIAGAIGNGYLDALAGGLAGILNRRRYFCCAVSQAEERHFEERRFWQPDVAATLQSQ